MHEPDLPIIHLGLPESLTLSPDGNEVEARIADCSDSLFLLLANKTKRQFQISLPLSSESFTFEALLSKVIYGKRDGFDVITLTDITNVHYHDHTSRARDRLRYLPSSRVPDPVSTAPDWGF